MLWQTIILYWRHDSHSYCVVSLCKIVTNLFVPNAPFLYQLKASENLTVFWCFQRIEKGCIRNEWVKYICWRSNTSCFSSYSSIMPTFITGTKLKWKYFVRIDPFKISVIPISGCFFRVVRYKFNVRNKNLDCNTWFIQR